MAKILYLSGFTFLQIGITCSDGPLFVLIGGLWNMCKLLIGQGTNKMMVGDMYFNIGSPYTSHVKSGFHTLQSRYIFDKALPLVQLTHLIKYVHSCNSSKSTCWLYKVQTLSPTLPPSPKSAWISLNTMLKSIYPPNKLPCDSLHEPLCQRAR